MLRINFIRYSAIKKECTRESELHNGKRGDGEASYVAYS